MNERGYDQVTDVATEDYAVATEDYWLRFRVPPGLMPDSHSSTIARRGSRCIGCVRYTRTARARRRGGLWCSSTAAPSPVRWCSTCETRPA
jgi:hypothetical protein